MRFAVQFFLQNANKVDYECFEELTCVYFAEIKTFIAIIFLMKMTLKHQCCFTGQSG